MTPIESPDEAEWDAFHEWLDRFAKEHKISPSEMKQLIKDAYDSAQVFDIGE